MQNWEYYLYNQAHQQNVPDYKADGSANFDDPAFGGALEWFAALGNVWKIQPSWLEFNTKKINWDAFMTGTYAMTYVGSWHLGLFSDYTTYPRDWAFGVAVSPRFDDGSSVLANPAAFAVNKNSANQEAAFTAIAWLAENWYKYNRDIPALASITDEAFESAYREFYQVQCKGEITTDELFAALVNTGMNVVDEKIVGNDAAQINEIYVQEAELYLIGERGLPDTMASIQQKANEIIARGQE
jgi:multiple sugar transport system substrate-binding protein